VVRGALERSTLAADCLELEITERTLMEDTETTLAILRELKQLARGECCPRSPVR
jgi:EAL domain-containing protein (putative c-di-GMP-specific phosphodiesterase class I)